MRVLGLARYAPVLLWGPPGVGKTASVVKEANEEGLPIVTVVASLHEPSDFGFPVRDGDRVRFVPPDWAVELAEEGKGVIFLDELTTAPPAVQSVLLRIVHERTVGDLRLPKDVVIVAAANPPEIAANGYDLVPPLANRFIHLEFKLDPIKWTEQFPAYWGNPPDVGLDEEAWGKARAMVASFIRRRPDLLLKLPKEASLRGRSWPSPRTWDFASRCLAMASLDPDESFEGIAGAVGEGAAIEFVTWAREIEIPEPSEVLKNPGSYSPTGRGDLDFAVLSAIAAYVVSRPTEENWKAAWVVLSRAAKAGATDIAAVPAAQLLKLRRDHKELPVPDEVMAFKDLVLWR